MSIFDEARAMVTRPWIESTFGQPGSHWAGNDFKTFNPLRGDRSIGSFGISSGGLYYDFADGSKGDVFDLLAAMNGITAKEAAEEILGLSGGRGSTLTSQPAQTKCDDSENQKQDRIKLDWKPIPDGMEPKVADTCTFRTLYRNLAGEAMFYVIRHDFGPSRPKEIFPLYYTGDRFVKGLPPGMGTRPLLAIERNSMPVLLVEGEKCCHVALDVLKGQYEVTTWHGGAVVSGKVELDLLKGRDVILWPDNDDVGKDAMNRIAARLKGVANSVGMVTIPDDKGQGWDIADAVKDGEDLQPYLLAVGMSDGEEVIESIDYPMDVSDRTYSLSDLGNAERMIDMYGHALRFNVDQMKWMLCDGRTWYCDDNSSMMPIVMGILNDISNDGTSGSDHWAHTCRSLSKVKAMLEMGSRMPGIPIKEDMLDPMQNILNCRNGCVDVRTGEMVTAKASWLLSKRTQVDYDREASCPRFLQFMDEIMLGRQDMVEFMQRWFGYCLTGEMTAQVFTIFYGNGANGKSTLVELISRIMGSYSRTAPPDTFVQKQAGGIPNDVAALRGSRLVLTTETEANSRLAESRIKNLTGGDRVSARFMRAEYFEFQPTWKIVISTNHRPRVSGADHGIWRRIVLIPFDFIATRDKMDPLLPKKLWEERDGILRWMIQGAAKWYADGEGREGLKISESIMEEVDEYKSDEDLIGRFIDDECWTGMDCSGHGAPNSIKSREVYDTFIAYAHDMGEKYASSMSMNSFTRAMRERGYEQVRKTNGVKHFTSLYPKALLGARSDSYTGGRDD